MKWKRWFLPAMCLFSMATCWKYEAKGEKEEIQPLIHQSLRLFLESSSATHSYFIHDGKFDFSEKNIALLMEYHSVTLVNYEGFDFLGSLFRNFFFDQGKSNVVLLCSPRTVLDILGKITSKNMESVCRVWLIFAEQDLDIPLTNIIREGMQIILVKFATDSKVKLLTCVPTIDNEMRFDVIGGGSLQTDVVANRSFFSLKVFEPPLVKSMREIYSDFKDRELVVSANNDWPFFGQIMYPNGTVVPDNGIDIYLVNVLGKKLNFRYRVVPPPDGQWGGPKPDGTVSGLIGMVARREAHLAIDEITITDMRERVIDFSTPYMQDSTFIISPSPKLLSRALAILSPFTYEVWGALILALFAVSPILAAIDALEKGPNDRRWTVSDTFFNTFRSIVIQGNRLTITRSPPRILLALWFLSCVVIYALYGSTLTAILAVPSYEKPIDSVLDVVDATKSGDFSVGTFRETSLELLFKEATFGSYKVLWERMTPDDLVGSIKEGFDKLMKEKYIYIMSGIITKVNMIDYGDWNFHIAKESIFPQSYGIACPSGAPYIAAFNREIMRLTEAGIIEMWVRSELQKSQIKSRKARLHMSTPDTGAGTGEPGALTLGHLQGAFFVAGIGILVALFAFISEIVIHKLISVRC